MLFHQTCIRKSVVSCIQRRSFPRSLDVFPLANRQVSLQHSRDHHGCGGDRSDQRVTKEVHGVHLLFSKLSVWVIERHSRQLHRAAQLATCAHASFEMNATGLRANDQSGEQRGKSRTP
jgi:hypothetical protein